MALLSLNLWPELLRSINYLPANKTRTTLTRDFHFLIAQERSKVKHSRLCLQWRDYHLILLFIALSRFFRLSWFVLNILCWLQLYILCSSEWKALANEKKSQAPETSESNWLFSSFSCHRRRCRRQCLLLLSATSFPFLMRRGSWINWRVMSLELTNA